LGAIKRHTRMRTQFDRDFDNWMEDPEFAAEYARERARIDVIDQVVRSLDAARLARRLSKAEVARQAGLPPQSVRRFFTQKETNPTLRTAAAIADVVGVQLVGVTANARATGRTARTLLPTSRRVARAGAHRPRTGAPVRVNR
jgi:DNA-binding phage protein